MVSYSLMQGDLATKVTEYLSLYEIGNEPLMDAIVHPFDNCELSL